jgi:hypothetical protein
MSRAITIGQIGAYAHEQTEKLLRQIVTEADERVKNESPVDLGRFRLSWAIGENTASFPGVPPGDYRGQPVPPPRAVNYQFGRERLGNLYSIHNNLPYAKKLADGAPGSGSKIETRKNPTREVPNWASPGGGSSFQTNGPGWIDNIANDIRTRVRDAAERINRES